MGSLSNLPPELIAHICEFVTTKQTLARLFQCSRQFSYLVAPHLYRRVDLISAPLSAWPDGVQTRSNTSHLEALAALFLRDPGVGAQVRHLAIRTENHQERLRQSSWIPRPLLPGIEDAALLMPWPAVPRIRNPPLRLDENWVPTQDGDWTSSGSEWSTTDDESLDDAEINANNDGVRLELLRDDELHEGALAVAMARRHPVAREDVILAILLTSLPRLEILDLEIASPTAKLHRVHQVLLASERRLPPFDETPLLSNLRSLCFGFTSLESRGGLRVSVMLPSVTSMFLHRMSIQPRARLAVGPATFNLTHLELRDCRILPLDLCCLLQAPKSLKTFIYEIGEAQTEDEFDIAISYKSVREALEAQKDSLEKIWIDYPHDYTFDEFATADTNSMGSFAAFTHLQRLRIAGTYLFGYVHIMDTSRLVRALPEQLEELHLSHADEDEETAEGIELLLEARSQGRFPKLRALKLDMSVPWLTDHQVEIAGLTRFGKDLGIEITLLDNHSESRIVSGEPWVEAVKYGYENSDSRHESAWGFDGEFSWPERQSGCMKRPEYEKIEPAANM